MYGGKIDDKEDFEMLSSMVQGIFDPAAYEVDHELVTVDSDAAEGLKVPSGTTWKDFQAWVDRLPEREPPTYLGLPANAEKVLLVEQGRETMRSLGKVIELLDERMEDG